MNDRVVIAILHSEFCLPACGLQIIDAPNP
jgi:hypothetical protein